MHLMNKFVNLKHSNATETGIGYNNFKNELSFSMEIHLYT